MLYHWRRNSACSIIRRLRDERLAFNQIRKVMDSHDGLHGVDDITITCQMSPNREGKPADLTPSELAELTACLG
jgi:hypothetical protein